MAADPIDKYIGKWEREGCRKNALLTVDADRKETHLKRFFVSKKTSSTEASFQTIYKFYLNADCAGDAVYTITKTGENLNTAPEFGDTEGTVYGGINKLVYIKSETIADGSVADHLEYTAAPLGSSTSTVGTDRKKTISLGIDRGANNAKTIAKIDDGKLIMKIGDKDYPTTFGASPPTFIKDQPQ